MVSQLLFAPVATAFLLIISVLYLLHLRKSRTRKNEDKAHYVDLKRLSIEPTPLSRSLASEIPDSVILPSNAVAFEQSMNSYWAQQECEVIPACVSRPYNIQQLCTAVKILKHENDRRRNAACGGKQEGLFAIRSGGHSPVAGAASIKGGVVIDLSLFCEVTLSEDGSLITIGAGAKWMDVSKVLDKKGLAVLGGRDSAVGVGGLILGGGLSFFSPRFGLVCSNIVSYEIVLASGSVTTASATSNPDLWCALKGGSNNFGIVTRFTTRSFPCGQIWSGFLYIPAFEATKALAAFHDFLDRSKAGDSRSRYDDRAAGPLACFTYNKTLGIQAIAINLVHTEPLKAEEKQWPACWKTSSFPSLWRFWSTCKIRSLTSATDEMNSLNLPGRRQVFATTTIKNDPATLHAAHTAHQQAITSLRPVKIKGLVWTFVIQPLLPEWVRKGDANPLGLHDDSTQDPLVIVCFSINWDRYENDDFVKRTLRHTVEEIDTFAEANGTSHPFRYLNYCADWQNPFKGYGVENWRFLKKVSRKYDPEGLFQTGCVGGFKLGIADDDEI